MVIVDDERLCLQVVFWDFFFWVWLPNLISSVFFMFFVMNCNKIMKIEMGFFAICSAISLA